MFVLWISTRIILYIVNSNNTSIGVLCIYVYIAAGSHFMQWRERLTVKVHIRIWGG